MINTFTLLNIFNKISNWIDNLLPTDNIHDWLFNKYTFLILLISCLIAILNFFISSIKSLFIWRNRRILNRNLDYASFSKNEIIRATQYYIETKYQNVSPSDDEEPGSKYIASAKNKLIPLFINEAFKYNGNDNKYYLILADTGMGKTTFMINLYLTYINKIHYFWQLPKKSIVLYSLGDKNTLENIQTIPNKINTILLLDAFDEDIDAISNYKSRIREILDKTEEFNEIIITCRTQFFPSEAEEPYSTGYMTFGDGNSRRNFQKLYLSVFNNADVKKYLRKRIPIYKYGKYLRALKISRKSANLVVRPMLLSHIEDLVTTKNNYDYSYQVYQTLIEKWIERESQKPGIETKYKSKAEYSNLLLQFSKELAVDMYINKEVRGGYFVTNEDGYGEKLLIIIPGFKEEIYSESERRSRSLLNRNAVGKYKFSHKSIMEYFLAIKMTEDKVFADNFNFKGNDAAKLFYNEMLRNEIFYPIIQKLDMKINNKLNNNASLSIKLKSIGRYYRRSFLFSFFFDNKHNKYFDKDITFFGGLRLFEFLYKSYYINIILRNNIINNNKELFNDFELLYKFDDETFNEIGQALTDIERIYFSSSIVKEINHSLNYNEFSTIIKTMNSNFNNKLDHNYLLSNLFIIQYLSIFKNSHTYKVFQDQEKLLKIFDETKNVDLQVLIGALIALNFDIYRWSFMYRDYFFSISRAFENLLLVKFRLRVQHSQK